MKLQELLNKLDCANDCILTIKGLCNELPFDEYERLKKEDYWKSFCNRKVKDMNISFGNYGHSIELTVHLVEEE